jgi:hypothetical protein
MERYAVVGMDGDRLATVDTYGEAADLAAYWTRQGKAPTIRELPADHD